MGIEHFGRDCINQRCAAHDATPLMHATRTGKAEMIEWLVNQAGADQMISDKYGATALHHAAGDGQSRTCQVLLSHGNVPVDVTNDEMWTPLHCACAIMTTMNGKEQGIKEDDRLAVVRVLIEARADRHAQNNQGITPVDYAELMNFIRSLSI